MQLRRKVGHKHCSQKRFLRLAGNLSPTLQKAAIVTKNTSFLLVYLSLVADDYFHQEFSVDTN